MGNGRARALANVAVTLAVTASAVVATALTAAAAIAVAATAPVNARAAGCEMRGACEALGCARHRRGLRRSLVLRLLSLRCKCRSLEQ